MTDEHLPPGRAPGFYWVRLTLDGAVVVAWWRDIYGDGTAFEWAMPSYVNGARAGVEVLAGPLQPPECAA